MGVLEDEMVGLMERAVVQEKQRAAWGMEVEPEAHMGMVAAMAMEAVEAWEAATARMVVAAVEWAGVLAEVTMEMK